MMGRFYWVHQDRLGSGRKLTDANGAVRYRAEFDPFGQMLLEWSNPSGVTNLNSHKFTGYERDEATGLDNAKARMYHSARGRFMQSDPVGLGCGNKNPQVLAGANQSRPQSLNRYSYVQNDPVNFTDRMGLWMDDPFCIVDPESGECLGDPWGEPWGGGGGNGCKTWKCTLCRAGCTTLLGVCFAACPETGPGVIICVGTCIAGFDWCWGKCKEWDRF